MARKKVENDYSKLKYNPMVLSRQQRMWEVYRDFANRKLLSEIPPNADDLVNFDLIDLDKMLKFIVLFVDPLSPFAGEKDFDIRMDLAFNDLGFNKNVKFWKFIENNSLYYQEVLFEYFKMVNSHSYEFWFAMKMSFHLFNKELRSGEDMKSTERARANETQFKNLQHIIKLENSLFPDEVTKKMISDQATQGMTGYAEKFALELEEY